MPEKGIDRNLLRLIAITDDIRDGQPGLIARVVRAVSGGATCIQVRLKDVSARDLVGVVRGVVNAVQVPVIVNDRADVAIAAGAAGVHLGADDIPARAVRTIAPVGFIVGASVGCDAEVEFADGADYVGIGPVFSTTSKRDAGNAIGLAAFSRLAVATGLPAVAIGGISVGNVRLAIEAGAEGVAAISAVFGAIDPAPAARALRFAIENSDPGLK